jgi:IclR family transcriptional regulator, acetate operon repressor
MPRKSPPKPAAAGPDHRPETSQSPERLHHDGEQWLLVGPDNLRQRVNAPGLVPAVEHAIAILEALNKLAPQPASLAELSVSLNISRSHCHSILKTLVAYGWLSFDERAKDYRLDIGILPSISSIFRTGILEVVREVATELARRIQLPLTLTKPQADGSYVLIDKFNVHHVMEVSFPIGHRYPGDAAGQMRAFLAWQSTEIVDRWVENWKPTRYTRHTSVNKSKVRAEIEETRRRGYSISDEEFTEGLFVISAPIFDRESNVAFILNCTSIKDAITGREKEIAAEVIAAIAKIHLLTGARVPGEFAYIQASSGSP